MFVDRTYFDHFWLTTESYDWRQNTAFVEIFQRFKKTFISRDDDDEEMRMTF